MTNPIKAALLTLTLATVAVATPQSQSTAFKFAPGLKLQAVTEQTTTTSMSGATSNESTAKSKTTQVITFSDKTDKGHKFELKVTDVTMDSGGSLAQAGMSEEDLIKSMKSVVDSGVVDATGKSSDVKTTGDEMAMAMQQGDLLAKVGIFGFTFPKDATKTGDTWKIELDGAKLFGDGAASGVTSSGGTMVIDYKLESITDGIATITYVMSGGVDIEASGMTGTMKPSGNGTVLFDVNSGLPTKTTADAKVNVDLGVVQVLTGIKSTVVYSVVK